VIRDGMSDDPVQGQGHGHGGQICEIGRLQSLSPPPLCMYLKTNNDNPR